MKNIWQEMNHKWSLFLFIISGIGLLVFTNKRNNETDPAKKKTYDTWGAISLAVFAFSTGVFTGANLPTYSK